MRFKILSIGLAAVLISCGVVVLARSAPGTPPETKRACSAVETRARLEQRFNFTGVRAKTPLQEGLEILENTFNVAIWIDAEAFKRDLQVYEPDKQEIHIPKLDNVSFRFILEEMLRQTYGWYRVDPEGVIWITTPQRSATEEQLRQRVRMTFDHKPLAEALRELASKHSFTIVVDEGRAGEKARTKINADLQDVRLETAVVLLADLAELRVVQLGRALYVTTLENACEIQAERDSYYEDYGRQICDDFPIPRTPDRE